MIFTRRVATPETKGFQSSRRDDNWETTPIPALKRRAKFNPTLRVEDLPIAAIGYFLGKASDL